MYSTFSKRLILSFDQFSICIRGNQRTSKRQEQKSDQNSNEDQLLGESLKVNDNDDDTQL
jgi:hypothetical protein